MTKKLLTPQDGEPDGQPEMADGDSGGETVDGSVVHPEASLLAVLRRTRVCACEPITLVEEFGEPYGLDDDDDFDDDDEDDDDFDDDDEDDDNDDFLYPGEDED